jgi:hypothetical protein
MISQPTDQCSPRRHRRPLLFIKTERGGKKNGEKTLRLDILQFFHSPFFQLNCHFWGERARSMISQPTDRCSPRCHCRPLAFIKTERGGKNNGEKTSCLDNFAVPSLTFFWIKLPFFGRMRDQWYRSPQTDVRPVATAALFRLLKQSGEAKIMVRKHRALTILQFLHSPFFQLNCLFLVECVIHGIAAHRPIFAPYPLLPSWVYKNKKEWWETIKSFQYFSSLTHHFSICSIFLGQTHDLWYFSPQADFYPTATATWMCLLNQSCYTKSGEKQWVFTILQFVNSPLSIKLPFSG